MCKSCLGKQKVPNQSKRKCPGSALRHEAVCKKGSSASVPRTRLSFGRRLEDLRIPRSTSMSGVERSAYGIKKELSTELLNDNFGVQLVLHQASDAGIPPQVHVTWEEAFIKLPRKTSTYC